MPRIPLLHRAVRTLWVLCLASLAWAAAPARAQDLPTLLGEPVTQVSARSATSCALTQSGGVYCWGGNGGGQLGNGTSGGGHHPVPGPVKGVGGSGNLTGVVAVGVNVNNVCALTQAGGVLCWGTGYGNTPVAVQGEDGSGILSGVAAIAVGGNHACALAQAGGVLCWGDNGAGQLGDGTTANRMAPAPVYGLSAGVAAIVAGEYHTCALTMAGAVQCWGGNGNGQLGDGGTAQHLTPVPVLGLGTGVASISSSAFHTCAVLQAGTAQCWGNNFSGQLGDGSATLGFIPVDVKGVGGSGTLSGLAAISAGSTSTCALTTAGTAYCWGSNGFRNLGDGTNAPSTTPVPVQGLSARAVAIAAGDQHTCALSTVGAVQCWGSNDSGRLGNGTNVDSASPTATAGALAAPVATHVGAIAVRASRTCALTTGGAAYCWGSNARGQLGNGTNTASNIPVLVGALSWGATAITVGQDHTCAVQSGAAKCWGRNDYGQLGNSSSVDSNVPVSVKGLFANVTAISAGFMHTCAVQAGAAKCWGLNADGQLGDDSTDNRNEPVAVQGLQTNVSAIATGNAHTCAVQAGAAKCWGLASLGQLGNNSTAPANSTSPVSVVGLDSNVTAISAGFGHTCALRADAALCWGSNLEGELGNSGAGSASTTPVPVDSMGAQVTVISIQQMRSCAIKSGAAFCWGAIEGTTPVALSSMNVDMTAIATGSGHSCGIRAGAVRCRGNNMEGEAPPQLFTGQALNFTPGDAGTPLPSLQLTTTATLAATADTGNAAGGSQPISYSTWTQDTCTVSGDTVSPTATATAGSLCGVLAVRASQTTYTYSLAAAPTQMRLLHITQATPTLALSGATTSTAGQAVTFTATFTNAVNPTGTTTLTAGTTAVCSITLPDSTCSATLPAGSHSITATYAGDTNNTTATSNALAHTVAQATPTLAVAGPASSTLGQSVSFTATFTNAYSPAVDVVFKNGATTLCTVSTAPYTCTTATLPLGGNSVVASFAGDTNNTTATSNALAHTVNPAPEPEPDPTIPSGGAQVSLSPGQTLALGDSGTGGTTLRLPQAIASGSPATVVLPNGTSVRVSGIAGSVLNLVRLPGGQYALALGSGSVELVGTSGAPLLTIPTSEGSAGGVPPVVLQAGACNGQITRITASVGRDGSTQVAVLACHAVLDSGPGSAGSNIAASATSSTPSPRLFAGEQARWNAEGQQVGSATLGTPDGSSGGAGEPLSLPSVPGLTVQTWVPHLDAAPQRTGENLLAALREQARQFGLELSNPGAFGSVLLSDGNGGTYGAALLGAVQVDIDGSQPEGARFAGTGALVVPLGPFSLTLAPGVPDLPALARYVHSLGGATTLQADGVLLLDLQGQRFALQPGFVVQPGNPGVGSDGQGMLTWAGTQGRQQTLYPAAADFARLQALALSLGPDVQVLPATGGAIRVLLAGQPLTLQPSYTLQPVPPQHLRDDWWMGSDGRLYVRYPTLGLSQGFDVK
jgi:alpha-tubulin suppressor-like RCC1 family protein